MTWNWLDCLPRPSARAVVILAAAALLCAFPAFTRTPPAFAESSPFQSQSQQAPDAQATGSIAGNIVDQSGTPVFGAHITLTRQGQSKAPTTDSDQDGQFSFANVPPGPFQLSIVAADFKSQLVSGTLQPGEYRTVPKITLAVAPVVTRVTVKPESVIAQEQVKQEEQQRVLGVLPDFYVTYIPNAAPLDVHQKFQLAWKSTIDPVTFGVVAAIAGIEQEDGQFGGFGTGAGGYAKRYGASYADVAIGTFLGSAILPAVFKQDPRFFFKADGTVRSRTLYALAAAVICKGDNGHWQPNYSNILGNLGAGAISNAYYPPQNRNGVGLTFESAAIGIGATAAANLLEEFVVPKLTNKSSLPFHHQHSPPHS